MVTTFKRRGFSSTSFKSMGNRVEEGPSQD